MSSTTPRHAVAHRRLSALARGALLAVLGLALLAASAFAIAYRDIQSNIERHDIDDLLGERPTAAGAATPAPIDPAAGDAINVVVLGSDTRAGEGNAQFGDDEGQRADTTMLVHVSADRQRVEIVSIPRDSLVTIPSCRLDNGSWTEPRYDAMFNSAFALGADNGGVAVAAACTMRTIEELSGVFLDDFVVVDFAGFINVVDALGGVPMCLPEEIKDRRADADLPAGPQVLDGRDALAFARARYNVPGSDGSDISRISRQQELVGAIAREAMGKNLLTDLPSLYRFLDAATSTLTTGPQLGSIPTLAGLAYSVRSIDLDNVVFATMPFEWAGDRVRPSAEAEALWEALREDRPIEAALNANGEAPQDDVEDDTGGIAGSAEDELSPDEPTAEEATDGAAASPGPTQTPICP